MSGGQSADYDAPESWWRVTITHGALTKVSTARRRFRCEGHIAPVRHYIEPGQRYVRTSLPPDHPEICNDSWWHMRLCMACCPVEFTRLTPPAKRDDWHEFTEDVADASMCVCGVPALTHDTVFPPEVSDR